MIKKPITIQISSGLEARPIAMLVQVASQFESEIYVESGKKKVNAKSIMGMMTLGLDTGENVTITAVSYTHLGDVTYTPSGKGHGLTNTGDGEFVFMALIIKD